MGAGAAYWTSCLKAGVAAAAIVDARRLRALGSTGSPLPPEAYEWGWQQLGRGLWWAVISGGTDLASAFLGGTPELPTVPGEMQGGGAGRRRPGLGRAGPCRQHDAVGELVCVQADALDAGLLLERHADRHRYRDSYFDVYPWRLAPRRLAAHHRPGRRHRLRPQRCHAQPPRPPAGHGRDLPRGGSRAPGAGQPGGRPRIPRPAELHAAVRGAARRRQLLDDALQRRDPRPHPRAGLAPLPARRHRRRWPRSRARSPARSRSCR
jgi:hypothetical protein